MTAAGCARRTALWACGLIVAVSLAAVGGWLLVAQQMKERTIEALGPLGSAQEIDVDFSRIKLSGVRLRAPRGWPATDALRAERILLDVDILAALTHRVHVRDVRVEHYYLSVTRFADGRVQTLDAEAMRHARQETLIDHVWFERGTIELFDESVRKPAYRVLITNARARLDYVHLPALADRTSLSMHGAIRGPSHSGAVTVDGWMVIATRDMETHTTLQGVDIAILKPYLLTKANAVSAATRGTVDLTLDARVHDYRIHAPGTVVIHRLQLADSGNPLDTFLSIPTHAAVAALKNGRDDIKLKFALDGDLHDPQFSLNEDLMKQVAAGFAKVLGVNTEVSRRVPGKPSTKSATR
jgi:hypothetical protein